MSKYHYSGPAIDHSGLSPSGRVSKRARAAWGKREDARLFPPGYWDAPAKTEQQIAQDRAATLRDTAQRLRELADRGMATRKYRKQAEAFERQAVATLAKVSL